VRESVTNASEPLQTETLALLELEGLSLLRIAKS
jgi:hypothetical protein